MNTPAWTPTSNTIKFLSQKELRRLFNAVKKEKDHPFMLRDLAMFNIGYLCGLRVAEIGGLRREHFNDQMGEMFCPRLKNSISNTVRLDDSRIKLLKKYLREYRIEGTGTPLFLSRKKNPISARQVRTLMNSYANVANIPEDKRHWHTLKHSIAVHLLESGASIFEVKNYLGHKRVESTLVYAQFTSKQQDELYSKIRRNSEIVE